MKRSAASRAAPLLLAGMMALLGGACSPAGALPAEDDFRRAEALRPDDAALAERWERSCRLCHAARGGAPLAGHAPSWDARLAKGPAVLLAHTREGFNAMPPMGQCNDCSEDDLRRLIDFMSRPR